MEKNSLTLGSLFDGSGGFPLAGIISGITPVWASEVEPFPIRVTTKRLPQVKHYGDVSQMDGGKIEAVGSHEELLDTDPIYTEVYRTQNKGGKAISSLAEMQEGGQEA